MRVEAWRAALLGVVRERGDAVLDRTREPAHVTASCFVLSHDLEHVLLTLHRKIGLWLQLGGHVEATDATVAEAARREAREESAIPGLELARAVPVDLERQEVGHVLTGCAVHWDLGYLALVDRAVPFAASEESRRLEWWPVSALPEQVPATFQRRIGVVLRAAMQGESGG